MLIIVFFYFFFIFIDLYIIRIRVLKIFKSIFRYYLKVFLFFNYLYVYKIYV